MFEEWLIIFGILALLELITIDLVSIWFALGALAAAIAALATDSSIIQIGVFLAVSFICLILTKPIKKKINQKRTPTNLDRVVGMKGTVTETIEEDGVGEVKVDGKRWSAISEDNTEIEKGSKVEILEMKSTKLKVKKIEGVKN